ncbi:MAG: hypothetical protein GW941_01780 [Candidatus Pacebacteria bacterium]|nr:hypothetical protein [Candidatus Paceibacterota bacterium]
MLNEVTLSQLKVVLDQAQTALIVLGPNANLDQTASALALYESLRDLKSEVSICSPEEVSFLDLQGQEEIKNKLGNKDLSVSFDYDESSVDKVSYHIDEEKSKFYLIVKPKKGFKPLDTKSVSFDYIGAQADVIFLFGVHQYESLEHLYSQYVDVYDNATVVTIHNFEPEIGDINIDISGKSCWAESVLSLIENLGLELSDKASTNLLYSIDNATNNLSSFTATADTFESVAKLLRAGGRRISPRLAKVDKVVLENNLRATKKQKTSFELALDDAKKKHENNYKNEVQRLSSERHQSPPDRSSKKSNKNTKKTYSDNKRKDSQVTKDQMKDKDYTPENLGKRI